MEKLLGIEIPIIQAPMAGVQDWELAAAVAEAGGLGSIPCGMLSPGQIQAEIEAFKAHSNKPYNLNFFCHTMPVIDKNKLAAWEQTLSPYYREFGLSPPSGSDLLRRPFDATVADIIEPYAPPVISFHFGLPAPELLQRVKSWGALVLSSATTVEEGIWLEENGADIVVAQGYEAGGHRGMFLTDDLASQIGVFPLVSQLAEVLSTPLVASGGISSRKDIDAMVRLGAAGVQVGTSYLLCREAKTSAVHRQALRDQRAETAITNLFSGRPARGIRNRLMEDLGDVYDAAPDFPYASLALAPLRQRAESQSSSDFSPLWSGQNRSGCREISATELTKVLWQGI